ncbi:MAG: pilus assembly protein [Planctomycetota bacterium]|nr:pilus assembly protein [Planctomycetota bacterium]
MNPTPKQKLMVLAGASVLATGGLIWLAIDASGRSVEWAWAAAASPLAVRCLTIIVACMVALGLLLAVLLRARPRSRPAGVRGLFGDQGGTAAVEMALLFPFGMMIFMLIIQAALVFNANLVVHYAAFAAARVAVVVVPLNLANDPVYPEKRNWVRNPDVSSVEKSEKLEIIRRAAVMAVMPISAASGSGTPADSGGTAVQTASASAFRTLGAKDQRPWFYYDKNKPTFAGFFSRAKSQYDFANSEITLQGAPVKVTQLEMDKPYHWSHDRNNTCPYVQSRQGEWTDWGWSYVSYCPTVDDNGIPDARMDYDYDHLDWWRDSSRSNWYRGRWHDEELVVRVTYQFLLELPYANRLMGGVETQVPGLQGKQYVTEIRVEQKMVSEGERELRPRDYTWPPGT